ncbi:MAG TPA: hypothetical protein VF103_17685 [Polyangiaceae bacterium]
MFTFLALLVSTSRALAADAAAADAKPATPAKQERSGDETELPNSGDRALSTATAVVPGVVVHGMGHYVAGESTTGTRLLVAEGVGFGMMLGGLSVIVATGASKYFTGPAAATIVVGTGLFGASFFADIYGSVSPDSGAAGSRSRPPAWMETELGYRHIGDPLFAYENFLFERVSMQTGPLRLTPSAWFSTSGDNARYRVEGAYRLLGPLPSAVDRPVMNDHLDAVLGLVRHRYVTERFTRSSMELAVDTRYDLGHVGRTLRGAFVEAGLGYAFGRIDYDVQGVDVPADFDDLLLARVGFGAVFRGQSHPGSEARVYYDHRHDDYAAGTVLGGIPSGVAGHFGFDARWFFTPRWGFGVQGEIGAAVIAGVSILFRQSGAAPWSDEGKER